MPSKRRLSRIPCWLCLFCDTCFMDLLRLTEHVQEEHFNKFLEAIGVDIKKYLEEAKQFLKKLVETAQVAGKAKIHYPM